MKAERDEPERTKKGEKSRVRKRRTGRKMNNKRNYKKGYKNEIIQLLHIVAVIPYRSLRLLSDNCRMYQRAVREMAEDKTVIVDKRGGEKNIRLLDYSSRRVEYEKYVPKGYAEYYEKTASEKIKALSDNINKSASERVMKNSATQIMMYACGIEIGPDKRDLRCEMLEDSDLAFYSSNELKQIESYRDTVTYQNKQGEKTKKLSNSRISGLLTSPGGIYAVYNIGESLIEWKKFGEVKMSAYITQLISKKSLSEVKIDEPKNAVVIARDESLFVKICNESYRKNEKAIILNMEYAYDRLYIVPEDQNGILLVKMMITSGWRGKILNMILRKEEQMNAAEVSVDCDGYDTENNICKLVFLIPNLIKLKAFITRALLETDKTRTYQIYCYSFQAKMISELAGNYVKILSIDIVKFFDQYFSK